VNEQSDPNDPPPVLEYRAPQTAQSPRRMESIRTGCLSVWALLVLAVVTSMVTRAQGFLPVLALGAFGLLALGISRSSRDRHGGFFLGLFFGVVTVIGAAFLVLLVLCGGKTNWR
jgi:hypothetical protein